MPLHAFGGDWTEEKLGRLRGYLSPYMTIFSQNRRAQFLTTHYVDAFAGTGTRVSPQSAKYQAPTLFDDQDEAVDIIRQGSVQIALTVDPPFDRYLLIDKNPEHATELERLRDSFPQLASRIQIEVGDANRILQGWVGQINWARHRAVVFLDPYGMSVNWDTLQALGRTWTSGSGSVDLWLLIPVGQAVNRLLPRDRKPTGAEADRLTQFFGTDEWIDAFYTPKRRLTLFGYEEEEFEKHANFESISEFFVARLRTVFKYVAENSLMLLNSKNIPLYMLCFASFNPSAVRIANDILRRP